MPDNDDPFQAEHDSLPGFKFAEVGDKITGQIITARQTRDLDLDGNVRTWTNGDERFVWVFELDTDEDGVADQALWVRGNMYTALKEALKDAGVPTVGAVVRVEHSGLGTPPKKGYNAPKLFTAKAKAGPPLRTPADAFTGGGGGAGLDDDEPFLDLGVNSDGYRNMAVSEPWL